MSKLEKVITLENLKKYNDKLVDKLNNKANKSEVYDKTITDSKFDAVYTKISEIQGGGSTGSTDCYTKTESDDKFLAKENANLGANNRFLLGETTVGTTRKLIGVNTGNSVQVGSTSANVEFSSASDVRPLVNNSINLGSSTKLWKEIHGTTIYQNGKQVANKEDIPSKLSQLENDSGYVNESYFNEKVEEVNQTSQEAKNIALGKAKAVVFDTVDEMTSYLKNATKEEFKIGDNLYIRATDVPDYWISVILDDSSGTYGYYEISQLETQKVDLSNLVTKDGYSMRESDTIGKFYYNTGAGEKPIQVKMPTIPSKTSQLTNDSGFLTSHITSIDGLWGGTLNSALRFNNDAIIKSSSKVVRFGDDDTIDGLGVLAKTGSSNYFRPGTDNTMDLGCADGEQWKNIYAKGTIYQNGNAVATHNDLANYVPSYLLDNATGVQDIGWTHDDQTNPRIATANRIAHWNGAYDSNGASNLKYCEGGIIATQAWVNSSFGMFPSLYQHKLYLHVINIIFENNTYGICIINLTVPSQSSAAYTYSTLFEYISYGKVNYETVYYPATGFCRKMNSNGSNRVEGVFVGICSDSGSFKARMVYTTDGQAKSSPIDFNISSKAEVYDKVIAL